MGESSFCFVTLVLQQTLEFPIKQQKTKQKVKIIKDFKFQDFQALIVFLTIEVISIDSFASLKTAETSVTSFTKSPFQNGDEQSENKRKSKSKLDP